MHQTLSLILVFTLTYPPLAAAEQNVVTLEERLSNMTAEVERFLDSKGTAGVVGILDHEASQVSTGMTRADEAKRIRAKVVETSIGTEITMTLRDGEVVRGELTQVGESHFSLRVPASEQARRAYGEGAMTQKDFRYEDVVRLFAGPDPRTIETGKRVEVRLVGGESFKGRLTSVGDDGVRVDNRVFTFEEVLSVKKLGIPSVYIALIMVGAVVGTLVVICGTHGWCQA